MRLVMAAALLLSGSLLPRTGFAQGETAEPLRPGTLRVGFGGDWQHWVDRFGKPNPANPGLRHGERDPNGSYFSAESLGTARIPLLAPVEAELRTITALGSGYALNLGRASLRMDASLRSTPIRIDYAPARRFGLSVAVPLVRARMSVSLIGPDTTNDATFGNVGLSPELTTPGALATFRSQAEAALAALLTQAQSGPPALQAQAFALYNRWVGTLCGMYALAGGSASDSNSPCFRNTPLAASPVLPVDTSEAGDSLATILSRSQTEYESLRAQYAGAGVGIPAFTAAYVLPTSPLDAAGLSRVFTDPSGALASDSLAEVVRTGLGDMEIGGWLQLMDTPAWQSQLSVIVRLGTGTVDTPDNLVDIGTGDGQTDVEIITRNDVSLGRRLRLFVGARYGVQMADQQERRVTPWYLPIVPASATALMERDLGDYFGIDVAPHWQLDESISVGFGYHYFRQGATTFAYANAADETAIGVPASVLGEATEVTRMRAGVGVTYNTLSRYYSGRAKLPLRVTWSYQNSLYGRGGQVPRAGVLSLTIQTFIKL